MIREKDDVQEKKEMIMAIRRHPATAASELCVMGIIDDWSISVASKWWHAARDIEERDMFLSGKEKIKDKRR